MAESAIHGTGLFAITGVAPGEVLIEYRGRLISKEESRRRSETRQSGEPVYTVAFDELHDLDGDAPENLARFANHSCDPNAELIRDGNRLVLRALRAINDGEEITFDYGFGLADAIKHPCRCGKPGCIGRILAAPLRTLFIKNTRLARPRR